MISLRLDHSEATEDSLKTDRAYVQNIDRILTCEIFNETFNVKIMKTFLIRKIIEPKEKQNYSENTAPRPSPLSRIFRQMKVVARRKAALTINFIGSLFKNAGEFITPSSAEQ